MSSTPWFLARPLAHTGRLVALPALFALAAIAPALRAQDQLRIDSPSASGESTRSLVVQANAAFRRGDFVAPAGNNALELLVAARDLDPSDGSVQVAILGATLVVVDVIVMCGYATLAGVLRRHVQNARRMRVLNRVFGSMFVGAGALLAGARHT